MVNTPHIFRETYHNICSSTHTQIEDDVTPKPQTIGVTSTKKNYICDHHYVFPNLKHPDPIILDGLQNHQVVVTAQMHTTQSQTNATHDVMEQPAEQFTPFPEKLKNFTINGDKIYYPPAHPYNHFKFSQTLYLNTNKNNEDIIFPKSSNYTTTTLC